MASFTPPKKAVAYTTYFSLYLDGAIVSDPALASGDVKVSKDGGALANAATLPVVEPASGPLVKLVLSGTEMDADNVAVVFSDQTAPAAWDDVTLTLQTAANQYDDLSTFDATTDTVDADVVALDGNGNAAMNLAASAETIVRGEALTGTLSTTQMTTDLTETTDAHYVGRVVIWTTGDLAAQAARITAYNGTSKLLTYTETTSAPANGDTFVIV
jgi:hypothetical protein